MATHRITFDLEPGSPLVNVTPGQAIVTGRRKWSDVDGNPSEAFHKGQYLGCSQYRDWFVSECGPVTARMTAVTGPGAQVELS
jgi:hypothetical protein